VVVLWLALSLLSSVSKYNMWSYYDWVCRCRQSVNTICDCNKVGFVVIVVRQYAQYVAVLWLGLSLFSVSKHNMWL